MIDPIIHIALPGQRLTLTRPAKHGLTIDVESENGKRVHLRVFTYHAGQQNGVPCELPDAMPVVDAITHFRSGMEAVREWMVAQPIAAATDLEASGQTLAETVQALRPTQEGGEA